MNLDNVLIKTENKTFYRDGDSLIKVFSKKYSKANVFNEVLNQIRVEEIGINIPKIREVTLIDGRWAVSMDFIEGQTLESLMEKDPSGLDSYLKRFIEIQRSIHEKRSPLLTKFKDKMTSKIMQCDLDASTRYDLCLRLNKMPMHNHVCHGDFNPSNVIISDNGLPFVVDWAHASQGNATADAAKTALIFRMENKEDLADKYLSAYCEITGTPVDYVDDWTPIVAAAQLVKVSTETKKKLMRWINGEETNA